MGKVSPPKLDWTGQTSDSSDTFDSGHLSGAPPLQFDPFNSGNLSLALFLNGISNFPLYGGDPSASFTTASLNQGSYSQAAGPSGKSVVPTYDQVSSDGHLKIDLIWDSSVANAPKVNGINVFQSDVKAAAMYLTSQFHDNATINITVGYGTIAGYRVPASALGESITNLVDHIDPNNQPLTFANLSSQLASDAAKDGWAITYPDSDPTLSGHFWVTTAEAKALGWTPITQETLTATNNNGGVATQLDIDGHVGFSSFKNIFDYTSTGATDTVGSGQYDFYATVLHEVTEVMGRMVFAGTSVNGAANSYEPLDLFRFQGGSPDVSSTKGGHFSIDGGVSGLHDFNGAGGDYADWDSTQGADAFNASGSPGVLATNHGALPDFDLKVMDAIGWDHLV